MKVRYKDRGNYAKVYNTDNGLLKVVFLKDVKAATLGQSAVIMDELGDVIGGGVISEVV